MFVVDILILVTGVLLLLGIASSKIARTDLALGTQVAAFN